MTAPIIKSATKLDRRQFLSAAGGLLLAFSLELNDREADAQGIPGPTVNAWVRISPDETVTILIGSSEMGQGIYSGLSQIMADELIVDWSRVRAEPAPAAKSWVTGGSSGIRRNYLPMRTAAAAAREMLRMAAANYWGVLPSVCTISSGVVTNTLTGQTRTYGQLAALASTLPVPANPPLLPVSEFKLIGKPVQRLDIPAKTDGSAKFGIDATVPGMVFAVIKNAPVLGATVKKLGTKPATALAVVNLDTAVAVVATNTWQAMQAASSVQVTWNNPANYQKIDSTVFATEAATLMASGPVVPAETIGDVQGAFSRATKSLDLTYSLPYLAHACMEVLNCTVAPVPGGLEIWAPTQAPGLVLATAAAVSGYAPANIIVHPMFMGGGLGRKIEQDYIIQAVRLALAINKPVKLTWPRPEDMGHDQYRPMSLNRVQIALDASGNITGWKHRIVQPSISFQRGRLPASGIDGNAVDGAIGLPYNLGARLVEYARHTSPVPVGYWRSVGNSINGFVLESAIDEVAAATGVDPLALRRKLLAGNARTLSVVNAVAAMSGWDTPPPKGHARGIAICTSFNSIVAEVVEVSQPTAGSMKVHNVWCAIDCGAAVNPNSVEAQMQGGIFHGLSSAMWGEVKFKAGAATVRNFSNYRVTLMREAPEIAVQIVDNGGPLGGVGEPGVPPVAPALANAWFRLTGKRLRSLPFFPGATMHEG